MNLPKTKVITEKIPRGYRLKEVFKNDKFVENSDVSTTASRTTISADGVITRHPMPGVEVEPQVLQPKVITPQSVPPRMKPANVVSEKDGRKKSVRHQIVTVRKPFNISEEGKNTLRSIFERGEGPFAPKTEVQTMAAKKGKEVVAAKRGKEVVAVNEGREVVAVNEGRAVVAINEGRAVVAFNEGREVVPRVDVPNDVDVWEILRHWALQKLRHWVQVIDDHYAYSLIILVATALYLAYVLFYDVSDHMNKEWKYLAKMKSAAAPMRVFYYVMRAIKAPIF
ncbi:hypothetical protein KR018_006807 [Drosophila ironensis]|nr:hypothetical protein KR018_006807 [Drosophila ironensis]